MGGSGLLSRRVRVALVVVCGVFVVVGVVRGASWMAIVALLAVIGSQLAVILGATD